MEGRSVDVHGEIAEWGASNWLNLPPAPRVGGEIRGVMGLARFLLIVWMILSLKGFKG